MKKDFRSPEVGISETVFSYLMWKKKPYCKEPTLVWQRRVSKP